MNYLQPIENLIYEIRGQKVMIDRDLARIYGVETRTLNQAVKRNIERFPHDFMFQLTVEEFNILKSQIVISNENWKSQIVISNSEKMGLRKRPYAFTELGVSMLSSVLNSKTAITENIRIMRAFVLVRQLILNPPANTNTAFQQELKQLKEYVEEVFADYNDINEETRLQLEQINRTLAEMQSQKHLSDKPRRKIGYFTEKQRKNNEDMID